MSRVGLARPSRFHPDRSRPAGVPLRPDRGGRAAGEARAGPDRPRGLSEDHRRRRHAHLHPARAGLQLRGGAHVRRADLAPGDAREAAPVHHAALGRQAPEESRVFRLPADRQIEDHRRALCAARVRGRARGDAAGLERSGARPAPKQFHIHNARERFRQKGDLFRGVLDRPQNLYEALGRLEKLFK